MFQMQFMFTICIHVIIRNDTFMHKYRKYICRMHFSSRVYYHLDRKLY